MQSSKALPQCLPYHCAKLSNISSEFDSMDTFSYKTYLSTSSKSWL